MAMLLATLLMSCATTSVETEMVVPELVFPEFPDLVEYEVKEGGTLVDNMWIIRLAEYRILIEETEKTYNEIRGLYNGR